MIVALLGCVQAQEATATFDDLVVGMYADFDDDEALHADVEGYLGWLGDGWDPSVDGYSVRTLTEDDLTGLEWPTDHDPADAVGATALAESAHTMDQHMAFVKVADQSVVSSSYVQFDRTFPDEQACFPDPECPELVTTNVIVKTQLTSTIQYTYDKVYRRVDLDDGTYAVIARGAVPTTALDEHDSGFWQSYNQDAFVFWGDGIVRLQTQWTEIALLGAPVDADSVYPQLISGIDAVFEDTDSAIDDLGL